MYDIKLHTLVQFIIYQLYLNKVNKQCFLGEKKTKGK